MAVAGQSEPWVMELKGRVEEALDAAIVPVTVRSRSLLV